MSLTALPAPSRDVPTQEIRITRRALRRGGARPTGAPGRTGWSAWTLVVLAALATGTGIVGTQLVARVAQAQDVRSLGEADAAVLASALEAARSEAAALAGAVAAAEPAVTDARMLAEAVGLRSGDLSEAAVAGVADAAARLAAAVDVTVAEPALGEAVGSASALPERYVGAGSGLAGLRDQVMGEVARLEGLRLAAAARSATVGAALEGVRAAVDGVVRAAQEKAPQVLAGAPEASGEARARLEQAVAALVALGAGPDASHPTREALREYFAAADGLRVSHAHAVAARLAAEEAARRAEAAQAAEAAEAARRAETARAEDERRRGEEDRRGRDGGGGGGGGRDDDGRRWRGWDDRGGWRGRG